MTDIGHLQTEFAKHKVSSAVVNYMDDQLVLDSSGAWVRKTAQMIAEKPLLPLERFSGLPCTADKSSDLMGSQHEGTHTVLLD